MLRFDWYQGTFRTDLPPSMLLDRIAADLPGAQRVEHRARGRNGYDRSAVLLDNTDHPLVTMLHGGNQGAPPNLTASGPDSPAFAHTVRTLRLDHGVTRADACGDLEGEDFDQVAAIAKRILKSSGMSGLSFVPDDPDKGPTYKAGAATSAVQARIYRKDLELIRKGVSADEFPQPIVRVEAQIRPKGALRTAFATMEPQQLFGASQWLRRLASEVLDENPALIVMQKREPTDYEKQLSWLKTQAHKALSAIYARHPSPELLGNFIIENIINPC